MITSLTLFHGCSRSSGGSSDSSTDSSTEGPDNGTNQGETSTSNGCEAQSVVENSSTSIFPGEVGETVLIDCNEGFRLNGETATLTCGSDGQWQGVGCVKSTLSLLRENLISIDSTGGLGLLLADRYFFNGGYYERYVLMEDGGENYYYLRKYDNSNNLDVSFADENATDELPSVRLVDDISSLQDLFEKSPNACMIAMSSGEFLVMGALRSVTTDEFFVAAYNSDGTPNTNDGGDGLVFISDSDVAMAASERPNRNFLGNSKSCIKLSEQEFLFSGLFSDDNDDLRVFVKKLVLDESGTFSFDNSFAGDGTLESSIFDNADFTGEDESSPELVLTSNNQFILKYEMEEPKGISFERYDSSGVIQGVRSIFEDYDSSSGDFFRRTATQRIYGLTDGKVLFSTMGSVDTSNGSVDSLNTVVFDPSSGSFSDVKVSIGDKQQETDFFILDAQYFPKLGKQILLTYTVDSSAQRILTYYVVDNDLQGTVNLTSGKKYTLGDFDDGFFPLYSNIYYLNDIFNLDVLLFKGGESSGEELEAKHRTFLFN